MILLRLFLEFFKTGLFSVGGGNAAIPFMYELCEKTDWFTVAELTDMIAVSEATPGAFGVNAASYVGYTTAGIPGCIAASVGFVAPSVIIILLIARVLAKYRENRFVNAAFAGLRPASLALICVAFLQIVRIAFLHGNFSGDILGFLNFPVIIIAAVIFFLMQKFKWHPLVFVFASAAVGIILHLE